jgi:sugar (pentulose or hexulose) kinase
MREYQTLGGYASLRAGSVPFVSAGDVGTWRANLLDQHLGTAAVVRCCLESLALKYRWVVDALEELTGRQIDTIRIVGGGSQNALLCKLTADACGRNVVADPVEATALGNLLVQAVALGTLPDIAAGRAALVMSSEQPTYEPHALPTRYP